MILLDQMKNMKVYKVPLLMPTLENDKKRHSAMLLLTPNYDSSKAIIKHPLLINRLRYQSYYVERDVSYYINGKISREEVKEQKYFSNAFEADLNNIMPLRESNDVEDKAAVLKNYIKYSGYEKDVNWIRENFNHSDYKIILRELVGSLINVNEDIPRLHIIADRYNTFNEIGVQYDVNKENALIIAINPELSKSAINEVVAEAVFNQLLPASRETNLGLIYSNNVRKNYPESIGVYAGYIKENKLTEICDLVNISYSDIITEFALRKELGDHRYLYYEQNVNVRIHEAKEFYYENALADEEKFDITNLDEESYITNGNTAILFENTDDTQLKKILYYNRIKKRSEMLSMLKYVKTDIPEIKYAYPELNRYSSKNIFIDLHYYTEIFFKNMMWKGKKGFSLFLDFMSRLINDPRFKANGYTKKTLVIPIADWTNNPNTRMWLYKQSINPVSIIYQLMLTNDPKLKSVFKDCQILFLGSNSLFKLDVSQVEPKLMKQTALKLGNLVRKTISKEAFDDEDMDTEYGNDNKKETKEVIKANIIDKVELSKGVDLTGKDKALAPVAKSVAKVASDYAKKYNKKAKPSDYIDIGLSVASSATDYAIPNTQVKADVPSATKTLVDDEKKAEAKGEANKKSNKVDEDKEAKKEHDLAAMAAAIDQAAATSSNTDDALDSMDNNDEFKEMLADLSVDGTASVDPARASRMNKLDEKFLSSEVEGKSVKDILEENPSETPLEKSDIDVASPNEEWHNLTYMNFDKNYDLNKDIIACFYHFTKVSHPIAIRKLDITDHTTAEDRLDLYSCQCEDALGQRFTIKLDIPKAKDNRFLLRGNDKAIKTQLFNMPILKTDLDTCQCISNYQKIMISRYNTSTGRSTPMAGRLIKALSKYDGKDLDINVGDNSRVCNKYELPVDYIDMAGVFNYIEGKKYKIYFNQDELHEAYPNIDDSLGMPYAINKEDNTILYFKIINNGQFSYDLLSLLSEMSPNFMKLVEETKAPVSGMYTRCSILQQKIPMVLICGLLVGLSETLKRAKINYTIEQTKSRPKLDPLDNKGIIRFSDGYLEFDGSYDAFLLLNGLRDCGTEIYSITQIDDRNMYLEMLDNFGGRIKADGLYNFYDCFVDPITLENLKHYHLPTDFIDILLYSNVLLSDNKFVKHSDMSSRRIRRAEMIAAYTYESLGLAYGIYANQIRHHKGAPEFTVKQSAVIDKFLASDISSDSSTLSALSAIETTNEITFKGKAGLNNTESYSLDKRLYDDSMLNVLGTSTNFSGNVGVNRVSSIDMNIEGERGYIKPIDGDTSQFNAAKTLSATEAMTPFEVTHDDSARINMTYIQTSKHMMRTVESDPLLVTNGFDQVVPYMTSDKFAFKAKQDGTIEKITDDMIFIKYNDGTNDYIDLKEKVEKNSDGGFYVPLKLDANKGIKEGSKVKKGDVVAFDSKSFSRNVGESDNLTYDIGKLAKIAIMNTDGGYEDAGMCTERLSNKLASHVIKKVSMIISKDATISKFAAIGDHVKVNEPLVIWSDPHDEEDVDVLSRTLGSDVDVSEFGRRSLKSNTTGTIADIRLYRTNDLDELSPTVQKIFKAYEKPIHELKKELEDHKISTTELPADYKLDLTGKLKKARDSFLVEFFVEFLDTIAVGDKITYYAANKATIDTIIPEDKAPYTDFRPKEPIDAFVSVTSVDKRMVSSTLIYGSLQKLLIEMDRSVKDILGISYDETEA